MKRLSGGIDVGSEFHHITILDQEDHILYNQKVSHRLNEFTESINLFRKIEKTRRRKDFLCLRGEERLQCPT